MDVIHRLKEVIVEVERMTDHVILVGHRVVARVLLAYFMGLDRDKVADLHIPIGHLYVLEPVRLLSLFSFSFQNDIYLSSEIMLMNERNIVQKPYGVDFKAFEYDSATEAFHHNPDYKLVKTMEEKVEFERAEREMCEIRKAERQKSA